MKITILPCGCHRVDSTGKLYSCLVQYSQKGKQGIQTKKVEEYHLVKTTKTSKGYLQAMIHGRSIRMNRLIASNFLPNPTALPEVQHKNGIKTDNRICNLKWGNQKDNADDRNRHGHTVRGIKNFQAKLNDNKVREIKKLRATGDSLNNIARKFNVSKKLILLVVQNKIWKHVK